MLMLDTGKAVFMEVVMRALRIVVFTAAFILPILGYAKASAQDVSPTLLIETSPSDIAEYRRMVHIKYIEGNRVVRSFVAYNRTEFKRIDRQVTQGIIENCANGAATPLTEITAFSRDEARRAKVGELPVTRYFCIKNIPDWSTVNRDRYLDPIFETLPYGVQAF